METELLEVKRKIAAIDFLFGIGGHQNELVENFRPWKEADAAGLRNYLKELQGTYKELQGYLKELQTEKNLLLQQQLVAAQTSADSNNKVMPILKIPTAGGKRRREVFYQAEAILQDSNKTKGYRASMFKCAQHCLAYYALEGLERSIYYEEGSSDLTVRLLFATRRDAELFQNELLNFAFLHSHFKEKLQLNKFVEGVELEIQPLRVFYDDYKLEDNSESPEMSLNDVFPTSPSASEVSISHDPSNALQALEEERIVRQFNSKWYKCHLISQTVEAYKRDPDNIVYASHTFHQLFDGLNTKAGVGVIVKFEGFGGVEEVLVGDDTFENRQKILVIVRFRDRDIATTYGTILKAGTTKIDDYSYSSFLYARDGERMKYFLVEKYKSSLPYFQDLDSVSDDE